jgi:hypothetical protein
MLSLSLPSFLPALRRIVPLAAVALLAGISAPALLAGVSAPASASAGDMVPYATIGHWQLSANDGLCKAAGEYENGTVLDFSINAWGVAMIGITNPKWRIPEGSYDVAAQVDRASLGTVSAKAKDTWLYFHFALNEPTINLLSYGKSMYVTVGRDRYQYDLVRSEAMLKALGACAGPRIKAANPFSAPDAQANPYKPAVSNPFVGM